MPILSSKSPNLELHGAVLEIMIASTTPPAIDASISKQDPGQRLLVNALIDTGASCSSICESVVDAFNLVPRNIVDVFTVGGSVFRLLYEVDLILPLSGGLTLSKQVLGVNLAQRPYRALIGRDVLRHCSLFYNGEGNSFTLHF